MTFPKLRSVLVLVISIMALGCGGADAGTPAVKELAQEEFLSNPPDGVLILDVRMPGEFSSGHVPNALNIPHGELASRLVELDSEMDRPIVVYCKSGARAGKAASVLLEGGYTEIFHLEGDMMAWSANGLPTEFAE